MLWPGASSCVRPWFTRVWVFLKPHFYSPSLWLFKKVQTNSIFLTNLIHMQRHMQAARRCQARLAMMRRYNV